MSTASDRGITVIANPKHGDVIDGKDTFYPTDMVIIESEYTESDTTRSAYGYVIRGSVTVETPTVKSTLKEGGYFSVPGRFAMLVEPGGLVAVIRRYGYRGQLNFGAIEKIGRLSYIDGCSDSMLVYPPRLGDPCFNFLHFPPGILQTQHTHPTVRFGIVARGAGKAFRVPSAGNSGWEIDLSPGCVFLLHEQEQHSFRTTETDCVMDVIAYHPDSDTGPTDADHPMINRTYIGNTKGIGSTGNA